MRKAFDLRPLEFNDVLGRGFSLFMANFVGALRWMLICWLLPMLAVAVLFYFALEPYDWAGRIEAESPGLLTPSRYAAYYWLLKLAGVGFAFSTGAAGIYYMTARVYVGGNPSLSQVMRAVYGRFGHVAGTAFLHVVVVAGLTLLCWAPPFVLWDANEKGMAVLVGFVGWTAWLPLLLWYNSVYGLNTVVVMLDDAQANESYPRSAYLTKRARMRLIGVLFVVTLVVGAPGIPGLLGIPGAVLETLALEQGWPLLGVVVNLAWDAVLRFRDMPRAFVDDWIGVADDEARHFSLVAARLAELGHAYGDFDAHDGLWDMARRTAHSCLERMALVPRVLEARGLDVTPGMIARLRNVGDEASVAVLEVILREEEAHVAAGSRWFNWCCAREGLDPEATFAGLVASHLGRALRGPLNVEARLRAGFSAGELGRLEALVA